MKTFVKSIFVVFLLFAGCDNTKKPHICPQCNMPLPKSNINTSNINEKIYFDDIGCLVLYAKEHNINLKKQKIKVFVNDTYRYINPYKAYFTINEKTPMNYGFTPYEKKCKNCINFDEVILRMLRGEHMANPKIRKQILGY
jgi:hypothetical protein